MTAVLKCEKYYTFIKISGINSQLAIFSHRIVHGIIFLIININLDSIKKKKKNNR